MTTSSTLDGLPKQFIAAMRTLFDIMDDKHTGYVDIADIENRWQEDDAKGLPKGVIDSLRKVTPPNGMLTFERFCSGLKMCLIRNQVERKQHPDGINGLKPTSRPPSAPLLDLESAPPKSNWGNTVAIRPNNVISQQQRAISMPQLLPPKDMTVSTANNIETIDIQHTFEKQVPNVNKQASGALYGPPKPPRSAAGLVVPDRPLVPLPQNGTNNIDRNEIRNALQNWQMGLMMNSNDSENKSQPKSNGLLRTGRSMGDGKASTGQNDAQMPVQAGGGGLYQKNKANARNRREPRRHTLQNGIDYSMLKRMKQIEQEKEVLMQGLSAVEKAREWYLKQVAVVQEKMKYLGKMGYVEHWSEAQQERLELQRARVLEVNRHLAALTESWERGGLPLHMNLAVHHYPQGQQAPQPITDRLKQQNRLLTEEVSKKSERISALEREKANLIQVLQMRSAPQNRNSGQEEAVF